MKKYPLAKPVELPTLTDDASGRRIVCPQHGFRLGKISEEKRKGGKLIGFVLKCPRCAYRERRFVSAN